MSEDNEILKAASAAKAAEAGAAKAEEAAKARRWSAGKMIGVGIGSAAVAAAVLFANRGKTKE